MPKQWKPNGQVKAGETDSPSNPAVSPPSEQGDGGRPLSLGIDARNRQPRLVTVREFSSFLPRREPVWTSMSWLWWRAVACLCAIAVITDTFGMPVQSFGGKILLPILLLMVLLGTVESFKIRSEGRRQFAALDDNLKTNRASAITCYGSENELSLFAADSELRKEAKRFRCWMHAGMAALGPYCYVPLIFPGLMIRDLIPNWIAAVYLLSIVFLPVIIRILRPVTYEIVNGKLTILSYHPFEIGIRHSQSVELSTAIIECHLNRGYLSIKARETDGKPLVLKLHGLMRPHEFAAALCWHAAQSAGAPGTS